MIVLDTNVLSEIWRASGAPAVHAWFYRVDHVELRIAATTVTEVTYGIHRLPPGQRRETIEAQWASFEAGWSSRILVVDAAVAAAAGTCLAARDGLGRPMSVADAQIAGTCLVHRATLATRNVRDFEGLGIDLVDPWAA